MQRYAISELWSMMQSREPLNVTKQRSVVLIRYYCTVERTVRTYDATLSLVTGEV